ncbi:MAG: hypothetical protein N2114_05015 [Candidatus Goldbacteria bacterium]|nr:hypothetical protein [Candidatus Goldiibacteriota bacterium]
MFDFIKKLNEKIKSLPPEAQKMVKRVNILYKRFEEIVNIEMKLKNLFITDINTPGAKINFNFTYEKVKKNKQYS